MNCKPGELAIIVQGAHSIWNRRGHHDCTGSLGIIVTTESWIWVSGIKCWHVSPFLCRCGRQLDVVADVCLKPIQPDPQAEERKEVQELEMT
jgi:hypothetical protein